MIPTSRFIRILLGINVCVAALFFWIVFSRGIFSKQKVPAYPVHSDSSQPLTLKTVSVNTDWAVDPFLSNLQKFPTLKVFVKIFFSSPIQEQWLKKCSLLGAEFPLGKKGLLGTSSTIVFLPVSQILKLNRLSFINDIQVLVEFLASASYNLHFWLDGPKEKVDFTISLPYSRYGHVLQSRSVAFNGSSHDFRKTDRHAFVLVDTAKSRQSVFSSKMEFLVNISSLLEQHIRVWGENISLLEYRKKISRWPSTPSFTHTNYNIQFCDYVEDFVKTVDPNDSLAVIWKNISKKLNEDISYDWRKKSDFFSGNLPYNDIKDMYLTCNQLAVMRVGACPERSALEVAILRKLGIPARTVTRLFHIYAQIYSPDLGWISTSANVRQIPLCESVNSDISFFVSWKPNHPVRIKWTGDFFPKELLFNHARI